jgi:hypothetical protein
MYLWLGRLTNCVWTINHRCNFHSLNIAASYSLSAASQHETCSSTQAQDNQYTWNIAAELLNLWQLLSSGPRKLTYRKQHSTNLGKFSLTYSYHMTSEIVLFLIVFSQLVKKKQWLFDVAGRLRYMCVQCIKQVKLDQIQCVQKWQAL